MPLTADRDGTWIVILCRPCRARYTVRSIVPPAQRACPRCGWTPPEEVPGTKILRLLDPPPSAVG